LSNNLELARNFSLIANGKWQEYDNVFDNLTENVNIKKLNEKVILSVKETAENKYGQTTIIIENILKRELTDSEKKELLRVDKKDLLRSKGLRSPRGILLVGVPGCGKSLSAKAISASWKLPLYRLDFATVQGSYVGQSEQQLKDALTTAENVSPCILWIDEIEKGLSGAGSSNDGGVSTRMVGQFLFWLQESKKQVFVVATANDVSMLPSELLRRGRFDELFFIDLPTIEERYDIIKMYMRKYLSLDFAGELADRIVEMTEGFTGADLESTVRDLAYRVIANEDFVLDEENVVQAFKNVVPLSQTSPEKIAAIRDWGKERAVPASGKPIGAEEIKTNPESRTRKLLV